MNEQPSGLRLPPWADVDRWESFQQSIFEEICERFDEGNSLVIADVPTGGGKSLLAFMVHQYLGSKSMYVCHSKILQAQFAADFEDECVVIMGRKNYTPQEPWPDWSNEMATCADCDYEKRTKLCSYCAQPTLCDYTVTKNHASNAELPVANTAYFLGECNGRSSAFSGRPLVIADECDTLESEVMGQVSIVISDRMQRRLDLRSPEKKTVESAWGEWFEYALPHVTRKYNMWTTASLSERRRKQTLERLLENMKDIAGNLDQYVYNYDHGAIEFKPITVERIAPKVLWPHGQKWLCMSASVGSPEEFVTSLGYEGQWACVFAPSTFPKERRPINYVPIAPMTKKTELESWPKMADAVKVVLNRHPDERILIHAHSYALTKFLMNHLEGNGRDVFCYTNTKERAGAIELFEETSAAVLIAPSLDRGYDGKDDLVRCVVVCKLPFPYLGDKQVSTRLYSTKNGRLWYDSQTSRTIVQMVGRGMRHERDQCETYLLDATFTKFYSKWNNNDGTHRLFPSWFLEALDFNSDARFEIRQSMREYKEAAIE